MTSFTTTEHQLNARGLAVRMAAACRDPCYQSALVLAANAGLVACGVVEPFTPTLALHLGLLPFNAWRLLQALRADCLKAQTNAPAMKADVAATRQKATALRSPVYDRYATMQTVRLAPRGGSRGA